MRQATDDKLRLQTHTRNIRYLLHVPTRNGFMNGPPSYIYVYIAYLVNLFNLTEEQFVTKFPS
jgi:3-methyladenine DNA glycosylase Mpg